MKRPLTASVIAIAALAAPAAAISSGSDDAEVREAGRCSDASSSKIKVKEDDGRLEVEFEVDQNVNGDTWKVKFKDGSDVVFKGTARTKAPSGSFSIERKIDDLPGTDDVVAVGNNRSTGERCVADASL
jgi:hypothetical protein